MPFNFNYGGIINTGQVKGVIDPSDPQDAATKKYVDQFTNYLHDTDTELAGKILASSGQVLIQLGADSEIQWFIAEGGVAEDKLADDAVSNRTILDGAVSIEKLDSSVTIAALPPVDKDLTMNGFKITALADPESGGEAANMRYVDQQDDALETTLRDVIDSEIAIEAAARTAADNAVRASLDSEVALLEAADTALGARIDSEAAVRSEEDIQLQMNINAEASIRAQEDANLQAQIDSGQPDFNQYADLPLDQAPDSVFEVGNLTSLTHNEFGATVLDNHLVLLFDTDTLDTEDLTTFYTAGDHLRITDNRNTDTDGEPIFWTLSITGLQFRDIMFGVNATRYFAIFLNPFALLYNDPDTDTNELTVSRLEGGVGEVDSEWHLEIAHSGTLQVNTLDSDTAGIVRHANPGEGNSDWYLGGDGFWHRRDTHDTEDFMLTDVNLVSIRDTKWATREYVQDNHNLNGVIGDSETGVIATDPGLSTPTVQISLDTGIIATRQFVEDHVSDQGGYRGKIGYGLDTEGDILKVDTDALLVLDSDTVSVFFEPSGQVLQAEETYRNSNQVTQTVFTAGDGLNLDSDNAHTLTVDTEVIADTDWVKEFFVQSSNVSFTSGLLPTKSIQWLDGNGGVNDSVFLTDGYGVEWTSSGGNNLGLDVDTDVIANRQYVADYIHTHQTDTETLGYVKINSLGDAAHAPGDDAIAIGENAVANAQRNIAIGKDAGGYGNTSIAIGYQATAGDTDKSADAAVAIGASANADTDDAVAVGAGARAITRSSIAIGRHAFAEGTDTIHIGSQSTVGGGTDTDNVILIGHGTLSSVADTIAIGNNLNWEHAGRMGIADYIHSVNVNSSTYDDTDTAGAGALARGSFVNTKIQETQDMIHDGGLVAGTGLEYTGAGQFGANSNTNHTLNVDTDVIATQTYVNTHAGVITDTDISAGYGITVRTVNEGGQDHTEINVDTDVIANRAYVDAHSGGNANLDAGFGLEKVTDTEIALDTDDFPIETSADNTVSIDTLFGYRIKEFDMINNRIIFESFQYLSGSASETWNPSSPMWDEPLSTVTVRYSNNNNFQTIYIDGIDNWDVDGVSIPVPSDDVSFNNTFTRTATLTGAQTMDNHVSSSWASNGEGGSNTIEYQLKTNQGNAQNQETSTVNWQDVNVRQTMTDLGSQRFDVIEDQSTSAIQYNTASDADNITNLSIFLTVDSHTDSDTDVTAGTSSGSRTFSGLTIYHDTTVNYTGHATFVRPVTVMDTDTEARTYTRTNLSTSDTPNTRYPTWAITEAGTGNSFGESQLGTLGNNGYGIDIQAGSQNDSTTSWRNQNQTGTHGDANGATFHLVVPSATITGFRDPNNQALLFTPINGASGTAFDLGHSGHKVAYRVYSFNIPVGSTSLTVQPY